MYAFQIIYKESILYFKIKQCWVLDMTKLRLSVLNKGPLKVHVNRQPQMKRILAYLQNITCLKRNPNSLLSSVLPQMITTQLYQVKKKKDQQLFLSCFFSSQKNYTSFFPSWELLMPFWNGMLPRETRSVRRNRKSVYLQNHVGRGRMFFSKCSRPPPHVSLCPATASVG